MDLQIVKTKVKQQCYPGGLKGLAKAIGMTEQNLHRCIRGNRMQLKDLEKIADELHTTVNEFLNGTSAKKEIHTEGDYSPASDSGNVSVVVGDAVLAEKVKFLERIICDKDTIIDELKERVAELKDQIGSLKSLNEI